MKTTKRILSVMLSVLLVCGILPQAVLAAETEYDLWIEGSRVTSETCADIPVSAGKASFDPDTNTLTLDGVTLSSDTEEPLIRAEGIALTICPVGTSNMIYDSKYGTAVLISNGSLTINGSGEIHADLCGYKSFINVSGTFTMIDGALRFGGVMDVEMDRYALRASTCRFDGGVVSVDVGYPDRFVFNYNSSAAIRANDIIVSDGAVVDVRMAGDLNKEIDNLRAFSLIQCDSLTVTGGTLRAVEELDSFKEDGTSVNGTHYAVYAKSAMQISGGDVTAKAGCGTAGLFCYGSGVISGGNVSADGYLEGIFCYDTLSITGGTVEATADLSFDSSQGISANDGISVTGVTGSVRAKGSLAIWCNKIGQLTVGDAASDNPAIITEPAGGTIGTNQYGHHVIVDISGNVAQSVEILPSVSCFVRRNGGDFEPTAMHYGGETAFDVPVGETCDVRFVSNGAGKYVNTTVQETSLLSEAFSFSEATGSQKSLTFTFAPRYLPAAGEAGAAVRNDQAVWPIGLSGALDWNDADSIGTVSFTVVKGSMTAEIPDVVAPKGNKIHVPVTIRNSVGTDLSQKNLEVRILTDNVFNDRTVFRSSYFVKRDAGWELVLETKSGCPDASWDVTVEWADKDGNYNTACDTFRLSIVCPCTVGVVDHVEAKAATCLEGGNTEYWQCAECGKLFSDEDGTTEITEPDSVAIPARGHEFTVETVDDKYLKSAADCVNAAMYAKNCSRCGLVSETDTFTNGDPLGHVMTHHARVEPTCTDWGAIEYWSCSRCTRNFLDEQGTIPHTDRTTIDCDLDAHSWDDGVVTTNPTCTTAGVKTYTCRYNSAHTRTEPVDATGHTYGKNEYTWETDHSACTAVCRCTNAGCTHAITETVKSTCATTVKPMCEGKGETTYTAAFNNKRFTAQTATEEIAALGHVYDAVVTEPTCTENGYTTHTCSRCSDTYTDSETAALGHDDADNDGRCDRCDEQMQGGDCCKLCGKVHDKHTFCGLLIGWFHTLLYCVKPHIVPALGLLLATVIACLFL